MPVTELSKRSTRRVLHYSCLPVCTNLVLRTIERPKLWVIRRAGASLKLLFAVEGLTDRSRRPHHYAHKLPFQVENYILNVKREHGTWGARKIRERLIRRFSGFPIPAKSTIHAVLDRHGLAVAACSERV